MADKRDVCKYGVKCYQKNSEHHKKYMHPPKRVAEEPAHKPPKKPRAETSKEESRKGSEEPVKIPRQTEPTGHTKVEDEHFEGAGSPEQEHSLTHPAEQDTSALQHDSKAMRELIAEHYLVQMPEDFYSFWSFCQSLSKSKPLEALKSVGLLLVGPFDVLAGRLTDAQRNQPPALLTHWRYYYDPPELQTVLKGDDHRQYHLGYWRDEPRAVPVFVASNCAAKDCIITPVADNLFAAVSEYLQDLSKTGNPFLKTNIPRVRNALCSWVKEHGWTLDSSTPAMKQREKKVVARTFHRAGVVVPWDRKTELGYRPLPVTEGNLKQLLQRVANSKTDLEREAHLSKLQEIVTAADIANDECDFGTSLELGIDLFCFGDEQLHPVILPLLKAAYTLLNRGDFYRILEAHLANRRKSANLSVIKS